MIRPADLQPQMAVITIEFIVEHIPDGVPVNGEQRVTGCNPCTGSGAASIDRNNFRRQKNRSFQKNPLRRSAQSNRRTAAIKTRDMRVGFDTSA